MATKRMKRPSSARRHIKQETFSSFVSSTRLRRLQSLLRNGAGDSANSADAIVCIYGIDSRYNEGTSELVNYLLFDFFSQRRTEIERYGIPEETVDDMIFVIRRHSVDIYCNPLNYNFLLPYVSHWKNLHIHCLQDEDYEDEELAEEFKIRSFINMVTDCPTVAIPYCSCTGHTVKLETMTLEKWPIIQAYALEGFGGGGFFTMKHQVIDLSASIHEVYHKADPVTIETIVTQQLPLFERQWDSLFNALDSARSNNALSLTESTVGEAMRSYFEHGRLRSSKGAGHCTPSRRPFVAFGQLSTQAQLNHQGAAPSDQSTIGSSGLLGQPAHHMVCQAIAPKSPLSCRRTYFFASGTLPHPVTDADRWPSLPEPNDCQLLIGLYQGCIQAVLAAITVYATTLSIQQAAQAATECLHDWCETEALPISRKHLSRSVDFQIEAFDSVNRRVSLEDDSCSLHIKSATLTAYDVPSCEHSGQTLGSVSFGESFMNSAVFYQAADGRTGIDGEYVILTSHVPRLAVWSLAEKELSCVQAVVSELEQPELLLFGQQLMNAENVSLLTGGAADVKIAPGRLYIYEECLVYTHQHHGVVVLPKLELSSLHLYDGDSPSVVSLLIITYKEHMNRFIPLHLRSDVNRLFLAFNPKTKAFKAFNRQVLPVWKKSSVAPNLQLLETLPDELQQMHASLQSEYDLSVLATSGVSPLNRAKMQLSDLHRFLKHFEVGSVGCEGVAKQHMPALLGEEYDEGSFDNSEEMVITILSGLPGGGKNTLCQSLTKLAREDSRWTVLRQPIDSPDTFSAEQLQNSIGAAWNAQRRRKPGTSSKKMRALVVTPGYTDIVDVIQALVTHPDSKVAKSLKIGAVTTCIDPNNAFMTDNLCFPKLLDQCAQGWVNNVVFSVMDTSSGNLERVQQLVRAANHDVALLLANRGEVTRSTDVDLILSETAFGEFSFIRARYLSCPGWWFGRAVSGPGRPSIHDIALRFSQPLEKSRLISRLKGLRSSNVKFPFTGNVYLIRGTVLFADSQQKQELQYVVQTGTLTLAPAELKPAPPSKNGPSQNKPVGCCLVFSGCGLIEERLRDWLRGCARQKPEKKLHRTRASLTKTEINRVHKAHHLEPLPEGWFYNGSHFVSLAGDKSDTHPDLEEFLTSYLQKVNREVDQHNSAIDRQQFHDLFESMSTCSIGSDLCN